MIFELENISKLHLPQVLFEIEVKNLIFIVKQFLDYECSITPETLENKIWICQKLNRPCTITSK